MTTPTPPIPPYSVRAQESVSHKSPAQRSANLQKEAEILRGNPTEGGLRQFLNNTKPEVSDTKLNRQQLFQQYQAANKALAGSGHTSQVWLDYRRTVYSAATGQANGYRATSEAYDRTLGQDPQQSPNSKPAMAPSESSTKPMIPPRPMSPNSMDFHSCMPPTRPMEPPGMEPPDEPMLPPGMPPPGPMTQPETIISGDDTSNTPEAPSLEIPDVVADTLEEGQTYEYSSPQSGLGELDIVGAESENPTTFFGHNEWPGSEDFFEEGQKYIVSGGKLVLKESVRPPEEMTTPTEEPEGLEEIPRAPTEGEDII